MVSEVTAMTFVKALRHGRTCPSVVFCEDADGNELEVVVKLRTGKECSPTGLICELLASLLARDLDLQAPEPYIVTVDADFHTGISDATLAERFQSSEGPNFGCRHMGPGYTTWPQLRSIPASLVQDAAEIFAFDLMIQNPDRRQNKPNMLRKSDDLLIFDHEMAFSFLYAIVPDEYPWEGKGIDFARDHIFFRDLKGKDLSWDRLQGALEAIDDKRLGKYTDAIPDDWRNESGDASDRIQEYVKKARDNSGALFQRITEVLI